MMKSIPTFARAMAGKAALAVVAMMAAGVFGDTVRIHAAAPDGAAAGAVAVTVNYKGSGTVDGSHRVWVWLFDSPDIGADSMPIAEMSVDKNGATATFEVGVERVWIAVAYDEKGGMSGNAPPAPGSPIGIYASSTGAPEAVIPGAKGAVVVTFDDSQRMP
ncbi:MAG: hypothetical protein Q8T13_15400 [Acidobacteriota bacterium]|nr:hypothetical protein [Acidobacteriota bacterium]